MTGPGDEEGSASGRAPDEGATSPEDPPGEECSGTNGETSEGGPEPDGKTGENGPQTGGSPNAESLKDVPPDEWETPPEGSGGEPARSEGESGAGGADDGLSGSDRGPDGTAAVDPFRGEGGDGEGEVVVDPTDLVRDDLWFEGERDLAIRRGMALLWALSAAGLYASSFVLAAVGLWALDPAAAVDFFDFVLGATFLFPVPVAFLAVGVALEASLYRREGDLPETAIPIALVVPVVVHVGLFLARGERDRSRDGPVAAVAPGRRRDGLRRRRLSGDDRRQRPRRGADPPAVIPVDAGTPRSGRRGREPVGNEIREPSLADRSPQTDTLGRRSRLQDGCRGVRRGAGGPRRRGIEW